MSLGLTIAFCILSLIFGLVIGWIIAFKFFKKQIKNNPPITKQQIKDLYSQMGRKPSEKQIQQIMSSLK